MTAALLVTSAAEQDLTAAYEWYRLRRLDLGLRFLEEVDKTFHRIREASSHYRQVLQGYRRALMPRFPYGIYFSAEPSRVVVHAVLHLHRDPAIWQRRLRGNSP